MVKLPQDCRPKDGRLIFSLDQYQYSVRVDVNVDGSVVFVEGSKSLRWISLDGITFSTEQSANILNLQKGWKAYDAKTYRTPSFVRIDDICIVSGSAVTTGNGFLAVLPVSCRPKKTVVFGLAEGIVSRRFELSVDGKLNWIGASNNNGWISLDGIRFVVII